MRCDVAYARTIHMAISAKVASTLSTGSPKIAGRACYLPLLVSTSNSATAVLALHDSAAVTADSYPKGVDGDS